MTTEVERRALAALDVDQLIRRLQALVRIPSVSGSAEEASIQHVAADMFDELGLHTDQWQIDLDAAMSDPWFPGVEVERESAYGLVGSTAPLPAEPHTDFDANPAALVLQGHLDVVPPGDPRAWHLTDPFSAEVREGKLYGRGACDMKAGFAANLGVVQAIRDAGLELVRPLALHSVVGEEDGGLGAFATLRRGYRGDAAVLTEPTGGRLVVANAGSLTFRIEVAGRSAHGSLREEGVSAFEAFLPIHRALLELERERNQDVDPLFGGRRLPYALSLGTVSSGDWSSSVPDRLVAEGRFGVRLDEDPAWARWYFEDAVDRVAREDPWLSHNRPWVSWPGGEFASGRTDPAQPIVGETAKAVRDVGGAEPDVVAEVYGSDLRLYTGMGGIPTVHLGPGDPLLAHAPLEHVEVDELVRVTRALILVALRRCGVA